MIFGYKQVTEKNNIITCLEKDKDRLQHELQRLDALNEKFKADLTELRKQNQELVITNEQSQEKLHEMEHRIHGYESENMELKKEACALKSQLIVQKEEVDLLAIENSNLQRSVDRYRRMGVDEYIKIGLDLFPLEKLTEVLEVVQSKAFIKLQNNKRKGLLQKLITDIQILLCPIKTDLDLIRLLATVEESEETDYICNKLQLVSLEEVLDSGVVEKDMCVAVKKLNYCVEQEEDYLICAQTADEYLRKSAISKLVNVLYKIANWEGY